MSPTAVLERPVDLFDDDHLALRESVRTHLTRTAVPVAEQWAEAGTIPDEVIAVAADHGFVATAVPEEHGGLGIADLRFGVVVIEEAVRAGLTALALVLAGHGEIPARAIATSADPRAATWLSGLSAGSMRACSAIDADVRLDDQRRATGRVPMVIGAAAAGLVVLVTSEPDPSVLVVTRGAAGVTLKPRDAPLGLRAAGFADVCLDQAEVLVVDGADAAELLRIGRLLAAVAAVAAARSAVDLTVAYTLDRRAFNTPIATFQNSRQLLGGVAAELRGAQALLDLTLAAATAGTWADHDVAAAKLLATDVLARAVDAGVQLHGGYGYMLEYPISHAYADARFLRLHAGTSQELREQVADRLLA